MKKVLLILIVGLFMIGCDNNSSTRSTEPVEPVQPIIVQPAPVIPEPIPDEATVPTAGLGSIKGDLTCDGGQITTNYSFGNVDEDDKSFVIQYQRNGVLEDLTYPSTSTTGSRTLVKDIYYTRANDDDRKAFWIVTISYQGVDETYNLVTATIQQPECTDDGNDTAITVYEVK